MGNSKWGVLVFGIWLIATGLIGLGIDFPSSKIILAIGAIAAGVLFIVERGNIPVSRYLGVFLLSAWLIITGLITLVGLDFKWIDQVMDILAIAAGALILIYGVTWPRRSS